MTVEIPLSKKGKKYAGKFVAIVDDCDADLAKLNWTVSTASHTQYAYRLATQHGKQTNISLHRVVLERVIGEPLEVGITCDHINGHGLDCTRINLRPATMQEQSHNRALRLDNKSRLKGVKLHALSVLWVSQINSGGIVIYLGCYSTALEAHRAYCEAAVKYHGEFANFGANSPFTPEMFLQPERTPIQLPLFALETESAA